MSHDWEKLLSGANFYLDPPIAPLTITCLKYIQTFVPYFNCFPPLLKILGLLGLSMRIHCQMYKEICLKYDGTVYKVNVFALLPHHTKKYYQINVLK